MTTNTGWPDGFPFADYVRQARRRLGTSQRAFAGETGISAATVARIESGATTPSVEVFEKLMAAAGLVLLVAEPTDDDAAMRVVLPLAEFDGACRDGAGRRYPAHLDVVVDPLDGEWWGDIYGLVRPPETFQRSRRFRQARRELSRWDVRHDGPFPRWPSSWERAARQGGASPPSGPSAIGTRA